MTQRCLIIIPARNEQDTISDVIIGLRTHAPALDRLVVQDGSTDLTQRKVEEMGEMQLNLPFNIGYGLALQTGLKYAIEKGYDLVVCIDGDGQHQPEDVPALLQAQKETGADVVIGSRYLGKSYQGPLERRVGQVLFSTLTHFLIGHRIFDTTSGFKVLTARACEAMSNGIFLDFHIETIVRLSILGFKIVEYPVVVKERLHGRSMHTFWNAIQYPIKTLLLTIAAVTDALLNRKRQ
jgi:glycosyltransferase involved in cell wall biosynthesis